jgi:hypothetical protein
MCGRGSWWPGYSATTTVCLAYVWTQPVCMENMFGCTCSMVLTLTITLRTRAVCTQRARLTKNEPQFRFPDARLCWPFCIVGAWLKSTARQPITCELLGMKTDRELLGMKTDRIRTDITDIVFVFVFRSGFGFEYG